MTTVTLPGVSTPQDDTDLLLRFLRDELLPPNAEVLDVGTGTGAVALAAARLGARVTAIDISWRAVLNAEVNALLARLAIRVRRGDLLAPVSGRSFDLILSDPPYVPAPTAACPRRGAARAWDAGHDGRLASAGPDLSGRTRTPEAGGSAAGGPVRAERPGRDAAPVAGGGPGRRNR